MDKELIEKYRRSLASTIPPGVDRLPKVLINETDTSSRLAAYYGLRVESRGGVFKLDENTVDKIQRVTHWLHNSHKRGLLLMGNYGNGKTTILWSVYKLFYPSRAEIGNAKDIFTHYKNNLGNLKFWDEPLLLVDDLGAEPEKCMTYGQASYPMTELLLHRYERFLTTIIATNLDIDMLNDRYGERLADRLIEMFEVIPYDADSYRGQ